MASGSSGYGPGGGGGGPGGGGNDEPPNTPSISYRQFYEVRREGGREGGRGGKDKQAAVLPVDKPALLVYSNMHAHTN